MSEEEKSEKQEESTEAEDEEESSDEEEQEDRPEAHKKQASNKIAAKMNSNHVAVNNTTSHQRSSNVVSHRRSSKGDKNAAAKPQSDLDLLLDLNFDMVSSGYSSNFSRCLAVCVPEEFFPVLSPLSSNGLTVEGRFNRSPSVFSNSMLNTEIQIHFNTKSLEIADIHLRFDKVQSSFIHSLNINIRLPLPMSLSVGMLLWVN